MAICFILVVIAVLWMVFREVTLCLCRKQRDAVRGPPLSDTIEEHIRRAKQFSIREPTSRESVEKARPILIDCKYKPICVEQDTCDCPKCPLKNDGVSGCKQPVSVN